MTNKERIIAGLLKDLGEGFKETERYWQKELAVIRQYENREQRNREYKRLCDETKDAEDALLVMYHKRYEELEKRNWR